MFYCINDSIKSKESCVQAGFRNFAVGKRSQWKTRKLQYKNGDLWRIK